MELVATLRSDTMGAGVKSLGLRGFRTQFCHLEAMTQGQGCPSLVCKTRSNLPPLIKKETAEKHKSLA